MTLINLREFYLLTGVILALMAVRIARDPAHSRRAGSVIFWGLIALLYLVGDLLPHRLVGGILVALVVLGVARQVGPPTPAAIDREGRQAESKRLGNRLFLLALIVPVGAILGSLLLGALHVGGVRLADPKQASVLAVSASAVVAVLVGLPVTRDRISVPLREGGRILETFGWLLLLPQLLAALGGVLVQIGVGDWLGTLAAEVLPVGSPFAAVAGYCLGMAGLTMCLGNAFAAFAVITAGIGLPFIVHLHHGDPAIMAAIGMLSGYCGTLLTPMAANFNLVPALLLELEDRNAVIKAQAPMALAILAANIALMYLCVYRF